MYLFIIRLARSQSSAPDLDSPEEFGYELVFQTLSS